LYDAGGNLICCRRREGRSIRRRLHKHDRRVTWLASSDRSDDVRHLWRWKEGNACCCPCRKERKRECASRFEGVLAQERVEPFCECRSGSRHREDGLSGRERAFTDRHEEATVRECVASLLRDDACVAIKFDRETKPRELPPERRIPRHRDDRRDASECEQWVARSRMLELVRDDETLFVIGKAEGPRWDDDVMAKNSNDGGPEISRDERASAGNVGATTVLESSGRASMRNQQHEGERARCDRPGR
jgi:hypothetical protein